MQPRDLSALADILRAAEDVQALVSGQSEGAFGESYALQLAAIKLLEIIGEAARRVSSAWRQ